MKTNMLLLVLFAITVVGQAEQKYKGKRARLKGLVFEVEEWSTPTGAWQRNKVSKNKWNLWTTEQDVFRKRSMGASLQSPPILHDRARPEDGAPPLHTHITGIPKGTYMVYLGNPSRTITLSADGRTWRKFPPRGFEILLGQVEITDGTFDLWADDRYTQPGNPGPTYYDYIRFEKIPPPKFGNFAVHLLPNGRTQVSWISSVPLTLQKVIFGPNGRLDSEVAMPSVSLRNHRAVLGKLTPGLRYGVRPVIGWLVGSRRAGGGSNSLLQNGPDAAARLRPCNSKLSSQHRLDGTNGPSPRAFRSRVACYGAQNTVLYKELKANLGLSDSGPTGA